ncbi:MAG: hypothetical protein LBT89_03740 [Planctomycetaceae bacterium]|jgi:hypothetical protein|nr:hypothetical protein [Planctomycetaceae bacterium]
MPMLTPEVFAMTKKNSGILLAFVLALLPVSYNVSYGGLFEKSVEADPNKEYILSERNGPWLIHVRAFDGPNARQQANALVLEIRKNLRCEAYLYERTFVHDVNSDFGLARNPNNKTTLRYKNQAKDEEIAVVIGNFPSVEDNHFKKTLAAVKQYQPKSLQNPAAPGQTVLIRAFGFANPMLPPSNAEGFVDKFVESINIKRQYTLLRNPGLYTVQIATFSGRTVFQQDEIKDIESGKKAFSKRKISELEVGERAAVQLCKALREQGVEAYEFHSRDESIVTVGSFNSYGQRLPNGTVQYDPAVLQIIQRYQGQPVAPGSGGGQRLTYKPVIISGVECDAAPKITEVPRCRR